MAVLVLLVSALCVQLAARACPPVPPRPPPPAIEPGPRGRLTIRSSPAATVTLDGRDLGPTPVLGLWVDAGRHRLVLEASCGRVRRSVRVRPRQDVRLSLALCPGTAAPRPRR